MNRNIMETLLGAVVLVVAAAFFFFAYSRADVKAVDGYELTAQFDRVSGLKRGSEVRISGIKVGTVVDQKLDPKTYLAVVRFSVGSDIELATDTSARITSEGLLGDTYMSLSPGGAEQNLKQGDEIQYTQGAVDLISLVGQAVFGKAGNAGGAGASGETGSGLK